MTTTNTPQRPSHWQVEPDEYLGVDPSNRHYWLLNGNVFRTNHTGEPEQSTSWVSCETPFRTLGILVNHVAAP